MAWALGYMKELDCIEFLQRSAKALQSQADSNIPGLLITKETVSKLDEPPELC